MKLARILFISCFIVSGFVLTTQAQESPTSLSEAIDRSLEHATSSRIAEADKEAADAASGILSSDYFPKINSSLSYTRSQYPQIVTPIRQKGAFPPLDDQIYEANIQADWEVFDFGESRAIRKKTKALADAANIKYELAKMETIESTSSAFIQLQQLRELKKVQQERIQTLKKNREQLESLYHEGRVAEVDLLKMDDTIVDAEAAVISTNNSIDQTLLRLSDDLALKQQLTLADIKPIDFENDYPFNPDNVAPEDAPSVIAAQHQKEAADFKAKASFRAFLPQFNLFAAERFRSGSDLEIDDQWMVGVRLRIPLFAGKRIVNNQVKKKEAKSQQIQLEQTRQQYRQQLNKLTNAQFETQKRIQSTQTRITYLEETYRVENTSYREGRSTLTDLLTTESKLNSVRAELIAMRAQLRMINLNIAVLTGQLNKEMAIKLAEGEPL
ncbi:TolC family protein [Fodinibius sp. AD559]|uniref:TolC family protein n=1 Tax=Fodinibius sp. AD559 TaxID=3424179 RepID=UPI004046F9EA